MKISIRKLVLFLMVLTVIGCGTTHFTDTVIAKKKGKKEIKKSILTDIPQVIHGLGRIEGHYVTNSIEAFKYHYKRGFRVFEVDLNLTSDNRLVARHDWTLIHYDWLGQAVPAGIKEEQPLSYDQVMGLKIHGSYHPASWEDLLELMQKYPDVYFVTDTKTRDEARVRKTFSYLVKATKKVDPKLLDRIIPQIYDQTMLGYINSYHHFNDVIYTLYQLANADIPTPQELSGWCVANHVTTVAGLPFRLTQEMQKELHDHDITIYTHTINDPAQAASFQKNGIGIYTDYLFYDGKEFLTP